MKPTDLIIWAVSIFVALSIISELGVQDWIAKHLFNRTSRRDLEKRIANLEKKISQMEKEKD